MRPFSRSLARTALGPARTRLVWCRSEAVPRLSSSAPPTQCAARTLSVKFYSTQPPKSETSTTPRENAASEPKPNNGETDAPQQSSKHELPSAMERRRSAFNQKFSQIMDDIQVRALHASHALNEVTGYSGIEAIKAENAALEVSLAEAHSRVRAARLAYKTSNTKRANTQREVTTLLARKDTWSPDDLERFTKLYRADHELEGEVAAAQEALTESEADEQRLNQKLNSGILKRYHEEQIWSDRIRRASTWGTLGLMGMNFVLFIMFQFVAEPWKRKRLIKGVVEEESQFLEEVRAELVALQAAVKTEKEAAQQREVEASPVPEEVVEAATPVPVLSPEPATAPTAQKTWAELLSDPSLMREAVLDLFSNRTVDMRMKDASILVLEGVVAGATVAGSVALLLSGAKS
ncbi:Mdm33 family-domain-containing protein [Stachybotrys elegans]|uniref:Sensitive to high expression protein 9, mitochondrial n=1 Tax=Stachybotrys elegans TaxID=80388 RepID=A0A8K0WT01_9HYPO|nr:Mdm33 family-domain-containing protein [Stachybotrys elegans]